MGFVGSFLLTLLVISFSELWLLVRVSDQITFAGTLALCILTGLVGGSLVRYQGMRTLGRFRSQLAQGKVPADELLEGIVLIVLGALLIVPGFITDTLGFLLLIPPLRRLALRWVKRRTAHRITFHHMGPMGPVGPSPSHEVRDAEFEEDEEA